MADRKRDQERQSLNRADVRERTRRDLARRQRREPPTTFGRALAVLGGVGWPIVLLGAGGALLGRWLDLRFGTGVRLTAGLLAAGLGLGAWSAWRTVGSP